MNSYHHLIEGGKSLSRAESSTLLNEILDDRVCDADISHILRKLAERGETVEEIAGFVDTMRARMNHVEHTHEPCDNCGTGGDGGGTFSISTAAALMASACGLCVAKHGNRAASSAFGSADVLEALGYRMPQNTVEAAELLRRHSFVFLFAPNFHPAMAKLRTIRKALGIRTIFNLLGPLLNPAGVSRQVIGVSSGRLMPLIGEVAVSYGAKRLLVVHSKDGLDEFSISAPSKVREWDGLTWKEFSISPEDVGLTMHKRADIQCTTVQESAAMIRQSLRGESSGALDVTLFNAAALLYVAGQAESIADGVHSLRKELEKGRIAQQVESMIGASHHI